MKSPIFALLLSINLLSICFTISSVWLAGGITIDSTPQLSARTREVLTSGVSANIGIGERRRDIRLAESPLWVNATRNFAPTTSPTSAAAFVIAPAVVCGLWRSGATVSKASSSVLAMILAIISIVSIGNFPTLVSPESIKASAPSSTALAQSFTSARVGREFVIIESSI